MTFIDNAVTGLAGAVISAGVSAVLFWWSNRSRTRRLTDAWRAQADELDARLTAQYQGQIDWLKDQLTHCQSETQRLNGLLTRRRDNDGR